jgi:hypothetical protein
MRKQQKMEAKMSVTVQGHKWSEMSPRRRVASVLMALVQVSLLVAALIDIHERPAEQIKGSKGMWTALAFVNYVGPIAYFIWGRKTDDD